MPPKARKKCPVCKAEYSTKTCKCNDTYVATRSSERILRKPQPREKSPINVKRTREKPTRYDSLHYEKKKKRKRGATNRQIALCEKKEKPSALKKEAETTAARAKRRNAKKEEEDGGGDLVAKLAPEKQQLCQIILNEINRKLNSVVWKPGNV
jgi:hypothetical protein